MTRSFRTSGMIERLVAAGSVAVLLAAFSLSTAFAHAVVVRSEPADSDVLAQAPSEIRLWFSEPISPEATQARVLDVSGKAVPSTQAHVDASDPSLLVVAVPALPDGVYNVAYSALSEADGHPTRGHLVFRIEAGAQSESGPIGVAEPAVLPGEASFRWFNFSALFAMVGAIAVAFILLRPGRRSLGMPPGGDPMEARVVSGTLARAEGRVLSWALICALAAVVASTALLLWQASVLALPFDSDGSSSGKSLAEGAAWLATHTRTGLLWSIKQALLLAVAGLLVIRWSRRNPGAAGAPAEQRFAPKGVMGGVLGILSVAVLVLQAMLGHAAAIKTDKALTVLMASAHLIVASVWVGGLLALAIGLLPIVLPRQGSPAYAALVYAGWRPFGMMAVLSFGVLIATGLYAAGREVASPDALLLTHYGRTLIAKAALVLVVATFGMLNAMMLHPRLSNFMSILLRRRQKAAWTPVALKHLPLLVISELVMGGFVLLATAILVSLPPANGPEFAPLTARTGPVSVPSQITDDLLVTFDAKPNQPGQNIILIRVASLRRPARAEIMRVIVHFTFLGQDIGKTTTDAQEISPGVYQLAGEELSLAGPWEIKVAVRRRGLEDSIATFSWTVVSPNASRPVVVSNWPLEPVLTAASALLFAFILATLAALAIRNAKARQSIQHPHAPGKIDEIIG